MINTKKRTHYNNKNGHILRGKDTGIPY